jgi:hypothetical protein
MSDFSPVVPVDAVAPGKTAKFVLTRDGRSSKPSSSTTTAGCCLRQPPLPHPDDDGLGREPVPRDDGTHILCATHGALYEPDSGECVFGPPLGKCLTAVPLEVRDGQIWAAWPEGE